jgi:hypothetical protein
MKRCSLRIFLSIFGALTGFQCPLLFSQEAVEPANQQPPSVAAPSASELNIAVIAGGYAVNIVKESAAAESIVEVRDGNNLPVPGALVNFTSPNFGPTVIFPNGGRTFSLVAETNGRATVQEIEPVGTGPFKLNVTAEHDGHFASAQIAQTNYLTYADAKRANPELASLPPRQPREHRLLSNGAIARIVIGVAAATAAGVLVGVRTGGASANSPQAGGIGVGTPTVGAPH